MLKRLFNKSENDVLKELQEIKRDISEIRSDISDMKTNMESNDDSINKMRVQIEMIDNASQEVLDYLKGFKEPKHTKQNYNNKYNKGRY
ncbi:hypothetical protein [Schinkia azotoformans]|uniref:hypothetical protein n=1 Tax=Schinkia azotoformans TaxID=1454 RepID=UPI002DB91042|nr:hypothetical protein [Schinkia azotoformans]MEC1697754.1 hypothetical protein [Schinkia azotoformans]